MVVGGYSLDLYCDESGCTNFRTGFYGRNQKEAEQEAKKSNWTISRDRMTCRCPKH